MPHCSWCHKDVPSPCLVRQNTVGCPNLRTSAIPFPPPSNMTALEAAQRYIALLTSTNAGHRVDIFEARKTAKARYEASLAAPQPQEDKK